MASKIKRSLLQNIPDLVSLPKSRTYIHKSNIHARQQLPQRVTDICELHTDPQAVHPRK